MMLQGTFFILGALGIFIVVVVVIAVIFVIRMRNKQDK